MPGAPPAALRCRAVFSKAGMSLESPEIDDAQRVDPL
jgi:hypothetical protein